MFDGWTDERMDGRTDRRACTYRIFSFPHGYVCDVAHLERRRKRFFASLFLFVHVSDEALSHSFLFHVLFIREINHFPSFD